MSPAVMTRAGLPEITAEMIASLGEHRVLSTEQARTIHLPGRSLRRTQQVLASLERAGLICHVDARVAPRRLWFLSDAGADLAFEAGGLERRPKVLGPREAAGALRAHTLAVNDAAICFLRAARGRDDEFGPLSWRHEVAHPLSAGRGRRRRTLFADAVLTYLRATPKSILLEQAFLELDRATLSVDRLAAEMARYADLFWPAIRRGIHFGSDATPISRGCSACWRALHGRRWGDVASSFWVSCAPIHRSSRPTDYRSTSADSKTSRTTVRSRRSSGDSSTPIDLSTGSAIPPTTTSGKRRLEIPRRRS
jgi:Replication-relaxation